MPETRKKTSSGEGYAREEEQGVRRSWVMRSMSGAIFTLAVCALCAIGAVILYFHLAMQSELRSRTEEAAAYITRYTLADEASMGSAVRAYVASYEDKDSVEMQFVAPDGVLTLSSQGRIPGTIPTGEDSAQAMIQGSALWRGFDKFSGETVMAASVALVSADGAIVGVLRCVTSLRLFNLEVFKYCSVILALFFVIVILIYFTTRRFERAMMIPIQQINDTAQMIADGLYGVHIDPAYPDQIGELCKTLNNMSDAISRSEKMKNDFISSVSHELRTPLTAIGGWGETLLAGGAGESEETRRGLTIITSEAGRLARMVEELLDFSRMESGNLTMRMERIDLTPDIEDVVFMYMDSIRREGIILEYDEEDSLPEIIGDRNRLRQVFLNLLDNAIKHGGEGKRVRVETYAEAQTLVIHVRDYGAGIPTDELAHAKERFYKGSSKARGSGIGLAIADEIMKLHGGRLDIKSAPGQGTVATMTLPAIIGDPDSEML